MGNACRVHRERVSLTFVLGARSKQINVQDRLRVPEPKPDIADVIDTRVKSEIKKTEVIRDKVIVNGELEVKIVYEADKPSQPVHAFERMINFSGFVDVEGAEPGDEVFVHVKIEDVHVKKESKREVEVTIILEIKVRVLGVEDVWVVTDVDAPKGTRVEHDVLELEQLIARGSTQVIVKDTIDVPEEKPNVEQVLDIETEVDIDRKRIIDDKVIVNGIVEQKVIYVGKVPSQSVHVVHGTAPFTAFIDLKGVRPGMDVDVHVVVEDVKAHLEKGGDIVRLTKVLKLNVMVTAARDVRVVTDVRGDGVHVRREFIKAQHLLAHERKQVLVRELVEIPEEKPCVAQVLSKEAKVDVDIEDTRVIRDKVIVEGELDISVVYESTEPDQSVHVVHASIPFEAFIDAPGAREDSKVDVDVEVEHLNIKIGEGRMRNRCGCLPLDVNAVLEIEVKVFDMKKIHVVVDVECPEVEGICIGVVTGNRVNVRQGPSLGSPIITQLFQGDEVIILAFEGNWTRVALHDGREGFIFHTFVECKEGHQPRG